MAHPIIARLEEIKAAFNKQAVQKQDVVDFYLLSLLPDEFLEKSEIGPDHLNGKILFDAIVMALREEYIRRGMDELLDEAKTTRWTKEIPEEDMDEHLKPYFKYHESGYDGGNDDERDYEEDEEPAYDSTCDECGVGLYEDDVAMYQDGAYCSDCVHGKVTADIKRFGKYCTQDNVFVLPEYVMDDGQIPSDDPHHWQPLEGHEGHKLASIEQGEEYQKLEQKLPGTRVDKTHSNPGAIDYKEPKSPIKMPGHEVKPEDKNQNCAICGQPGYKHLADGSCPIGAAFFKKPTMGARRNALKKLASRGGPYWEAPRDFKGYTSTDYYNVFKYAPWKDMYGGPLWAEVSKTIHDMENTTDPKQTVLLIDHFHDLGHNTGKLLDKFPEWKKWFKDLLDLKASKDSVRRLIPMASSSVAKLVTEYYKIYRGEDWRKPNYPTTDFSKSDLNSISKDPTAPQEALYNAALFSAKTMNYDLEHFARRLDDDKLEELLNLAKKDLAQARKTKVHKNPHWGWSEEAVSTLENLNQQRHKDDTQIPSASGLVPHMEKKADEWQGQKDAQPFGKPNVGMWSDPSVTEAGAGGEKKKGASLSDAITFFIEHGDRFNKQPSEIDLTSKFVKWTDGSRSTFDEFVELYMHHIQKKDADFGMMDGPVDQGRHHDGDFPNGGWMPQGQENQDVSPNAAAASLIKAALESTIAITVHADVLEQDPYAPSKERGEKEVSKYDEEGEWLMKLVKLVIKEGVPKEEVAALANAHPVVTVDDAGDLAAQIWTLATTKYHIPREWLIKKLPDAKASLSKTAESLQRGNSYVMRGVDQAAVEVDPKVKQILTMQITDEEKYKAIMARIVEMFDELDSDQIAVKSTEWGKPELDWRDAQKTIHDYNEAVEEAMEDTAFDAMTPEERDQSWDRELGH